MLFEELVNKAKLEGVELLHGNSGSELKDLLGMHLRVRLPLQADRITLIEDGIKLVKEYGAGRLYVHTSGLEVLK